MSRHASCSITPSTAPSSRLPCWARWTLNTSWTLGSHVSWLTLQASTPRRTHGARSSGKTHWTSWSPQCQPGLLEDSLGLRLLGRDHGALRTSIAASSKPERQHEHGSWGTRQAISPRKTWATRGTPFSRVTHLASRTCSSWRSWKTGRAFRAWGPLYQHARLNDGWLSLLSFLTSRSSNPLIDGVLVSWHAWPYLRWGDVGVRVGVEVWVIVVFL